MSTSLAVLPVFEDGGRGEGLRIPRGPMWFTPLIKPFTDKLDLFFEMVDYRMLSTGMGAFSVLLVLVGALPGCEEAAWCRTPWLCRRFHHKVFWKRQHTVEPAASELVPEKVSDRILRHFASGDLDELD